MLPVHNVPVVHVGAIAAEGDPTASWSPAIRAALRQMDLEPDGAHGDRVLLARRSGISRGWRPPAAPSSRRWRPAAQRTEPLLLMIDGDIGKTLGQLLHHELDLPGRLVSIDGVQLQDLDYVDIGEMISPPGVVPVVIKSLLFS